MQRRSIVVLITLFLVLPVTLTSAEPPAPELGDDVAGIRKALDRLVVLLETNQHHQRVNLLFKRIELRERRLAPLERRLRGSQSEVDGLNDELVHMRAMKEQVEQEIFELSKTGEVGEGEKNQMKEIEKVEVAVEARLDEATLRARRYEDELADGRDEIEILDEMLLELLEAN